MLKPELFAGWRRALRDTTRRSPGRAVKLPGFHGRELPVLAFRGEDQHVGVKLRVGYAAGVLVLREPAGGVRELRGQQPSRLLEAHHPAASCGARAAPRARSAR